MVKINFVLQMLTGTAFLRPLLQRFGYDVDCGVALMFDSERTARTFCKTFTENLNAKQVRTIKKKNEIRNYEMGIHVYRHGEGADDLIDFLMEEKFLPVVLVGSRIPAILREECYFIRINAEEAGRVEEFSDCFRDFKNYIINSVDEVMTAMVRLRTSKVMTESKMDNDYMKIYKCLIAVGYIWKLFIRSNSTETKAEEFWKEYLSFAVKIVDKLGDYAGGYELENEIVNLVWDYVGSHVEVKISPVEKVATCTYAAMKKSEAVLYDEDCYYVPEKLVKKICSPLMDIMSQTELKEKLKADEIIFCNEDGFTVKKKFWTAWGISGRYRAMKFRKETLASSDGLFLEDVYGENEVEEKTSLESEE